MLQCFSCSKLISQEFVVMAISDSLLSEFDHEVATTRSLLERIPEAQATWKPHEKSMTLGELSSHIANVPGWVISTMTATELDLNPPGGPAFVSPTFNGTEALVNTFDENAKGARAAIAAASDGDMFVDWALKNNGETLFSMPRIAVLRTFIMNHLIHHRGQLSVYLRLQDVPLPSIYGPTADTPM
jgi:uncharacterized damage-inducible protein DinB